MDQSFTRLLVRSRATAAPALDYAQLTAALAGAQAASATGRAATLAAAAQRDVPPPPRALALLFVAGPGWAGAVAALEGRFHPGVHVARGPLAWRQP